MTAPELVVVGSGPAGMAAAAVTSAAGIRTVVIDEYSNPGGQYYRQPVNATARSHTSRQQRQGEKVIAAFRSVGPVESGNTVAYAVENGTLYAMHRASAGEARVRPGGSPAHEVSRAPVREETSSDATPYTTPLILAMGATERVVPLPGWTLPGVVTCGGAQALAKAYGVPIGKRVLVAGSGPFLLPVAATLVELGAQVVAVVEAQWPSVTAGVALSLSPGRFREAASYAYTLTRARVPMLFGHAITEIEGSDTVVGATVMQLRADGRPRPNRIRSFQVDAVALSDGFVPTVDLVELAGSRIRYAPTTRSYLAHVDPLTGATTAPNTWAAGACVEELCSAPLASASGTLAGLAAVESMQGPLSQAQVALRERTLFDARRHRAFAARLAAAYPTRPAWYRRVTDDTIVCRCEDVRAGEIRASAASGASDVNIVKRWTRAGMGLCQGRTCQSAVIELVAAAGGRTPPEVGRFRARPPVRPIPLSALASAALTGDMSHS